MNVLSTVLSGVPASDAFLGLTRPRSAPPSPRFPSSIMKWVPVNWYVNLTELMGVICDRLASHPAGVTIILAASCFRLNWSKVLIFVSHQARGEFPFYLTSPDSQTVFYGNRKEPNVRIMRSTIVEAEFISNNFGLFENK